MKPVSIAVMTFNDEKRIGRCIDSIMNLEYPEFEIIVVDGISTDSTVTIIKEKYPGVRIVNNMNNLKSTGFRLAIEKARYNLIAFTDARSEVPKNWLMNMTGAMRRTDSNTASIIGGYLPAGKSSRFTKSIYKVRTSIPGKIRLDSMVLYKTGKEVISINLRNMLLNKKSITESGMPEGILNDDTFEIEVAQRLLKSGYRLIYSPDISVVDTAGIGIREYIWQIFNHGIAKAYILKKKPDDASPFNFLPLFALLICLILPKLFMLYLIACFFMAVLIDISFFPEIALVIISQHIAYSIGFFIGLFSGKKEMRKKS